MDMRKSFVFTAAGLGALGLVSFGLLTGFRGGCGGGGHGGRAGWRDPARIEKLATAHIDDALDDLDATDAQRKSVQAVKSRLLSEGMALSVENRKAGKEIVAQWDASSPDAARIHALIDERAEAMRAFAHKAADAAIEVRGTLTPEQRATVSKKVHRIVDAME
jgi:Spy/CpxP family protein refolding chaperone